MIDMITHTSALVAIIILSGFAPWLLFIFFLDHIIEKGTDGALDTYLNDRIGVGAWEETIERHNLKEVPFCIIPFWVSLVWNTCLAILHVFRETTTYASVVAVVADWAAPVLGWVALFIFIYISLIWIVARV